MSTTMSASAPSTRTDGPEITDGGGVSLWSRLSRHRMLILAVTAGAVLIALLMSLIRPPVYLAEARLAVGSGQMTALNIPGYPSASQDMASDYARWLDDQPAQDESFPEDVLELTASPIIESNIIRVESTAHTEDVAVAGAAHAAQSLKDAVNQVRAENDPQVLMREIQAHVAPILEATREARSAEDTYTAASEEDQPEVEVERRFQAYIEATSEVTALQLEQDARRDRYRSLVASRSTEAELVDVYEARIMGNDRMAVLQRNLFLGLMGGLLAGTALALALDLRRARDRDGADSVGDRV